MDRRRKRLANELRSRDEVTHVKIKKSCFEKHARRFPGLSLETGGGDWRCTWHHHGSCVEVKQSCEGIDGVRVKEKELDGCAPGGRWQCNIGQE